MKKSILIFVVMMFLSSPAWACNKPNHEDCNLSQNQNQQQGQVQGQTQNAIGIGTGIADSTAISGSNSAAIVGVNSANENTNVNMNAPVAIGGGADVDNKINNAIKNDVTNIVAPVNNVSSGAIAEAGDSQAINTTEIGDNISGAEAYSEGSISDVSMGDINAGNSFSSSYYNSEKLDSYDTSIQVGSVRKSIPNISGYAGMSRYGYRDSWEFGIRATIPIGAGATDKAIEYETNKLEIENNYIKAQMDAINAEKARADEMNQLAMDKARMDIALLCEPFLQGLTVKDKADLAYGICKKYGLKKPKEVEKIVEKEIIKKIYIEKKDPCEKCPKPILASPH